MIKLYESFTKISNELFDSDIRRILWSYSALFLAHFIYWLWNSFNVWITITRLSNRHISYSIFYRCCWYNTVYCCIITPCISIMFSRCHTTNWGGPRYEWRQSPGPPLPPYRSCSHGWGTERTGTEVTPSHSYGLLIPAWVPYHLLLELTWPTDGLLI